MADDNDKALDMASQIADLSAKLMSTLRSLNDVANRATSSGIQFAGRTYENTALKYCDGDQVETARANGVALLEYMQTNSIDDVFDVVSAH